MSTRPEAERQGFGGEACTICGSPDWAAYWMGRQDIYVCLQCAEHTLPAIAADAVYHGRQMGLRHGAATTAMQEMRARYWQCIALAEIRHGRRRTDPPPAGLAS